MLRNLMLRLARDQTFLKWSIWMGRRSGLSRRFIAGESFRETLNAVRLLERAGLDTTLDLLGEGVGKESEAVEAARAYRKVLRGINKNGIRSGISIKLTQLGLDIGPELCSQNLKLILDEAELRDNFVRIDMEGSKYTQSTLDLFEEHLDIYGSRHVGTVIQSYLRRSEADVERLSKFPCNIRLCKGAYMEPPEIAFPKKSEVDESFKSLVRVMFQSPIYLAIATHDDAMIDYARKMIGEKKIDHSRYEFQMLYGVRRERQLQLRQSGYRMRVYVPFGTQWAPYFMRRLAERPANVLFILKNILRS